LRDVYLVFYFLTYSTFIIFFIILFLINLVCALIGAAKGRKYIATIAGSILAAALFAGLLIGKYGFEGLSNSTGIFIADALTQSSPEGLFYVLAVAGLIMTAAGWIILLISGLPSSLSLFFSNKKEHMATTSQPVQSKSMQYCRYCGAKLSSPSKYCPICGKSLED